MTAPKQYVLRAHLVEHDIAVNCFAAKIGRPDAARVLDGSTHVTSEFVDAVARAYGTRVADLIVEYDARRRPSTSDAGLADAARILATGIELIAAKTRRKSA